jgi:hypothetical protein
MIEIARPMVTAIAGHREPPSSTIAHNDPNRVAPKMRAMRIRSRVSGSSRRAVLSESKKLISQSSAPVTANSIAMTDWKN